MNERWLNDFDDKNKDYKQTIPTLGAMASYVTQHSYKIKLNES
jgi:hypothetical protein